MLKRWNLPVLLLVLLTLFAACGPKAQPTGTPAPTPSDSSAVTATASAVSAAGGWKAAATESVWSSDGAYQLSMEDGALKAVIQKTTVDAAFTASFAAVDISARPLASLLARCDEVARVSIGLTDADGKTGYMVGLASSQQMSCGSLPMAHTFDFSAVRTIDLHRITGISVAVDRGSPACTATAWFRDIALGQDAQAAVPLLPVEDQQNYVQAAPQPVRLLPAWGRTVGELTWTAKIGGDAATQGQVTPQGDGWQFTYALTGKAGVSPVELTCVDTDGAQQTLHFDIEAEDNLPPKLDDIAPQSAAAGADLTVPLSGIDDGNPAVSQKLTVTAASSDNTVAKVDVQYDGHQHPWGMLTVHPLRAGNTTITVAVADDAGSRMEKTFPLTVYKTLNLPPHFDDVPAISLECDQSVKLPLAGLTAGESGQKVRLTVTGAGDGLQATIDGNSLLLTAGKTPGEGMLTITATDNGGKPGNNGDASYTQTVEYTVRAAPRTGLREDFGGAELDPALAAGGEGAHTMSLEDGALRVDVDKAATGNVWAGLWYPIAGELDLSAHPVITLRMKASEPRPMCIYLWDSNDVYNTAGTVTVNVEKDWAEYTFDFTGMNRDADGRTVDFAHIKSLLLNFVPGMMFQGTFWLDDLRAGDQAVSTPTSREQPPVLAGVPRVTLGSAAATVLLKATGWDAAKATITFGGDYAKLLQPPQAAFADGGIRLTLTPQAGAVGQGRLLVDVAQGDDRAEVGMDVSVVAPAATADIALDTGKTFQTMDGFGAFLGSGVWKRDKQDLLLPWVRDAGITMARFGIIDTELEPANDNSNPQVTDLTKFNRDALPLQWMKRLHDEGGVQKFIVTLWSPPHWMKFNKSLAATDSSTDNYIEPRYFEEFAEHVSALCTIVREATGTDLYAVSVQNEPQFNEPYASALLDDGNMAKLIAVVGARLRADGFATKIYMPEALPQQKGIGTYIQTLDANADAAQYVDIVAIHNYDGDGIHVGGAGAQEWAQIYAQANAQRPRSTWMTETSGHPDTWDGAKTLFGNIHNALAYGNASAWLWWSFAETSASAEYGLLVDNQPSARYAVSRHFYKAIQPGAIRVQLTGPQDIIATAYRNPDGSTAVVLYNDGAARFVSVTGVGGAVAQAWVTQEGQLSATAQVADGRVLVPAGAAVTVVLK